MPAIALTAELLGACGCATLLLDLLTEQEEAKDETTCEYRFDIVLLEQRLLAITRWVKAQPELAHLPLGYFGSGAGSAAAFVAAAERGGQIAAIVSRGGRPDLAGSNIFAVKSPTLVLVGELDTEVLALNSKPSCGSLVRRTSRSSAGPRIISRRGVPWKKWPDFREPGSGSISAG